MLDSIGTTNFINIILGLIVVGSFFSMHFIEMASFGSRVAGRVKNRVALGTTLQLSIFTISRFFLIPFLPILAYLVETGIMIGDYIVVVIASYLLCLLVSILIILKLNLFQYFFQHIFENYEKGSIPKAFLRTIFKKSQSIELLSFEYFSFKRINIKKTLVSCFAYLFLITGFFLAFLLAILYPDKRLTLSQFTATFHGIGAIVIAAYIDPMLSRSIDLQSNDKLWVENIYSILLGRVLSYLIVLLGLTIFILMRLYY